jgi:hypothetical protein
MELLARMFFHLFLVLFVAVAVPISTVVALVAIVREFMASAGSVSSRSPAS